MNASVKATLILVLLMISLPLRSIAVGETAPATLLQRSAALSVGTSDPGLVSGDRDAYQGFLRIYIVEPVSRYRDYTNKNYRFGFLDFAVNQAISLNDGQMLSDTVIWNVGSIGAVSQTNIQATAVVSNAEGHAAFSSPGDGTFPFTAHWVDAAAASTPGIVGIDDPSGGYTHTVFLEEATAST